jgi:hypothetical protein
MSEPFALITVLVPTLRKSPQVMANLSYLAAISSERCRVMISDCSTDPEKHAYLVKLQELHPLLQLALRAESTPLYQDIAESLPMAAPSRYTAICADDDLMSLDYLLRSVEMLERDSTAVCSYGNFLSWRGGQLFIERLESPEPTPVARLQNAFNPSSFNSLLFTVVRRAAMQPWVDFCKDHVMIGPFFDFVHFWSLLAQGKILCHPKGFYLWTGENWDSPEKNFATRARYYTRVGLHDAFTLFHDLHFAVEGLNFLLGRYSPIVDVHARVPCSQIVWSRCMERFRQRLKTDEPRYFGVLRNNAHAIDALRLLLQQNSCEDPRIIEWFSAVVAAFSPALARRYWEQFRANRAGAV